MKRIAQYASKLGTKAVIITDDRVGKLYGKKLKKAMEIKTHLIMFEGLESSKTRKTKEKIEDEMLRLGFSRDTVVIALGGGVVTDLAGFVAATFMRGVNLIQVPTTLLAMVDASIGGKVGVNTPMGKNLIGAIYPAEKVFIEPEFLKTLPEEQVKEGLSEVMKIGLIDNRRLFFTLDQLKRELMIKKAIRIKEQIVKKDEKERGIRHILNFGHTVAHALEKLTDYQLSHGKAVFLGLWLESFISKEMGLFKEFEIVNRYFKEHLFFTFDFDFTFDDFYEAMTHDKKALIGKPRFVLLKKIGAVYKRGGFTHHVDPQILKSAYEFGARIKNVKHS